MENTAVSLSVRYADKFVDRLFLVLNQITMSVPPFFVGIIFTVLFGLTFRLFTPGGYVPYTESVGGFLGYLVLPSIAIALPKAAMTTKMLRILCWRRCTRTIYVRL